MEKRRPCIVHDVISSSNRHLPEGHQDCQKVKAGVSKWLGWDKWHRYMMLKKHGLAPPLLWLLISGFVLQMLQEQGFCWTNVCCCYLWSSRSYFAMTVMKLNLLSYILLGKDGDLLNKLVGQEWVHSLTTAWHAGHVRTQGSPASLSRAMALPLLFLFFHFIWFGGRVKQRQTHRNIQALGASEILVTQALVVPRHWYLFVTAKTGCKWWKNESPHMTANFFLVELEMHIFSKGFL